MRRSRRQSRDVAEFSLSFLDVISCGFGAIILLLMITKIVEPLILEDTRSDLKERLAQMEQQVAEIRGETTKLHRQVTISRQDLANELARLSELQQEARTILGRYELIKGRSDKDAEHLGQLAQARQALTEEMQRLLGQEFKRRDDTIGGIPVDSEYIIFVIDTSGSMFNGAWPMMMEKFSEVLDVYPEVKGIQIMNDMGDYMFSSYQGRWIPDTPARRKAILSRLATWNPFSNSSPVEGIQRAISTYWAPDKKISIYVFGDEFTGNSITNVVQTIDRINLADADGTRRVRIHAVGFPVQFGRPAHLRITGERFAALMRELTFRNNGTFVGLPEAR